MRIRSKFSQYFQIEFATKPKCCNMDAPEVLHMVKSIVAYDFFIRRCLSIRIEHSVICTWKRQITFRCWFFSCSFVFLSRLPVSEWSEAHMNFPFDAVRFSVCCQTERNHKQKWSNTKNAKRKKKEKVTKHITWNERQVGKPTILNKTVEKRFELRSHQMQIKANRKAICQIGGGFSCRIWCFFFFSLWCRVV